MRGQVTEPVKDERLAALQALLAAQQGVQRRRPSAATLPVLLERPGRHRGQLVGRTPYLQPVHVAGRAPARRC